MTDHDNDERVPGPPRVGALDNLSDVRREAAKLFRRAVRGEIDTLDASRLASVLALVGRVLEGSDLDERMAEIERRMAALVPRRCA